MPKKTVSDIAESENFYCIQVKGNQKTLHLSAIHTSQTQIPLSTYQIYEKGHGRHSHWQVSVFDASQHPKVKEWKDLKRFVRVERCGTRQKGEPYAQTAYYISNLEQAQAQDFQHGIRDRWHIENKLHWVKDVLYNEDENGRKQKNGPVNASVLSTIAINIHRLSGHESVSEGQIIFASNVKELINLIRT